MRIVLLFSIISILLISNIVLASNPSPEVSDPSQEKDIVKSLNDYIKSILKDVEFGLQSNFFNQNMKELSFDRNTGTISNNGITLDLNALKNSGVTNIKAISGGGFELSFSSAISGLTLKSHDQPVNFDGVQASKVQVLSDGIMIGNVLVMPESPLTIKGDKFSFAGDGRISINNEEFAVKKGAEVLIQHDEIISAKLNKGSVAEYRGSKVKN